MTGEAFGLAGRVAVVTGAGAGIGAALAVGLARAGADVAVLDIDGSGAEDTAEGVRDQGRAALAVSADVTDEEAVAAAFADVTARLGLPDALVNNAGVALAAPPEELDVTRWRAQMEVNVTGTFLCARELARGLIAAGRAGAVCNISSVAAVSALGRGSSAYGASKGAVGALTRELAVEWAGLGIRVNAVQPCWVRTPGFDRRLSQPDVDRALVARLEAAVPIGRLARPEDLVEPVVFLLSDAARMITGASLPVDGGNLALNPGGSLRPR